MWRWSDAYRCIGELNGLQVEREQPDILPLLLFRHIHNYETDHVSEVQTRLKEMQAYPRAR